MRALLTGGAGMLGRTVADRWRLTRPDDELVAVDRTDVDLRDAAATRDLLDQVRPDVVVHAAARVGGIAEKVAHPVTYLRDNLALDASVVGAAIDLRVPELLYVGSAAMYPQAYQRPFVEEDLLTGPLEPANEGYAVAKIAGAKLCEYASREHGLAFRVVLPSNLYGPYDHVSAGGAHLVAAALGKVHRAHAAGEPSVVIWGDGTARREFTWAGDLAAWLVAGLGSLRDWPLRLNLGCGVDHTIDEYYRVAAEVVGYRGEFVHDLDKPSGTPRRLLDSSAARALGWDAPTSLRDGMAQAYDRLRHQL